MAYVVWGLMSLVVKLSRGVCYFGFERFFSFFLFSGVALCYVCAGVLWLLTWAVAVASYYIQWCFIVYVLVHV